MSNSTYVIRTFPNIVEAQVAEAVLAAHGIRSALIRDDAGGMMPWLHTLHPVRLVVREADVQTAVRLLAESDDTGGDAPHG